MSSRDYFNLKKHRILKKKSEAHENDTYENDADCARKDDNFNTNSDLYLKSENMNENVLSLTKDSQPDTSFSSDDSTENNYASSIEDNHEDIPFASNPAVPTTGLQTKLRDWALRNSSNIRLNVISELLVLLREEGNVSLPKTAQTLLGTVHHRELQIMSSASGNDGE